MSNSDHDKSPAEVAAELWKRSEPARAAVQIPFVIWQAGGAPVPTPVQTDDPKQQRIEWRVQDKSEVERVQALHEEWAQHRLQELERENARAGDGPSRKQDRSRRRE